MPIESKHPKYQEVEDDWKIMRDWVAGERAVRANIKRYLPPPPGLKNSGAGVLNLNEIISNNFAGGYDRYAFYAMFAEFVDITNTTINAIQGLIHEKPPTIELPKEFEYLRENATPNGDTLEELWEIITRELLIAGRIALLGEVIEDDLFFCPYKAESLTNWHVLPKLMGGGPILSVLKEVNQKPKDDDPYELEDVTFYRELVLLETEEGGPEPIYKVRLWKSEEGKDASIVYDMEGVDEDGFITPMLFGNTFKEMPLVVINAINKGFGFGPIPGLPMAKRAIMIYRKTADYHRALYVKGDPQPILFGVDEDSIPGHIGGGEIWAFPSEGASAMYLDIDGQGIPLMKESIDQQYDRFGQETGQLADDSGGGIESEGGRARRYARADITIKSIVVNAGAAMEEALQQIVRARRGEKASVDDVVFAANTDFSEPLMSGKALLDYVMAKNAGGPISGETIHELARRHKVTDFTYEEELDKIAEEENTIDLMGDEEPPPKKDDKADDDDEETTGDQQVGEAEDVAEE